MISAFRISIEPIGSNNSDALIRWTSAKLVIEANGKILTRVYDSWANSVSDGAHVSLYPLALWFATNYWRLLNEPARLLGSSSEPDWEMAHHMSSAGQGYIWPNIQFNTDGYFVTMTSKATEPKPSEPITYLGNYSETIPIDDFEIEISSFVQRVINRLDANRITTSDLHVLWNDIKEEKGDEISSRFRMMEASIGSDPDEIEGSHIEKLLALGTEIGHAAADEIAKICSKTNVEDMIRDIYRIREYAGIPGQLDKKAMDNISGKCSSTGKQPWDYGRDLARVTRDIFSINSDSVDDSDFERMIGINHAVIGKPEAGYSKMPFGFASLHDSKGGLKIHFNSTIPAGRRFAAARLFADAVLAHKGKDSCLPFTDAATYRQKAQRAFAAEFLCPIDRLVTFLGGDLSEEKLHNASDYFKVSHWAITSHLRNNKKITSEQLENYLLNP